MKHLQSFIARINQSIRQNKFVPCLVNNLIKKIITILLKNDIIQILSINSVIIMIKINSKITNIKCFSKQERLIYINLQNLKQFLNKNYIIILSTPKGVMTAFEAKKYQTGGKLLLKIN